MSQENDDAHVDPLDRIIAEYLGAVESGQSPDREALLQRYVAHADELKSFFADHDRMELVRQDIEACGPRTPPNGGDNCANRGPIMPTVAFRSRETRHDGQTAAAGGGEEGLSSLGSEVCRFGDFELLEEIARGGMGVVYKARQVSLNRVVALKMILAGEFASAADVTRFYREAEAAANLDHPHIVPIYAVGEHGGHHYYSMGYVAGQSLAQRIQDGPLPPHEAARHTKRIAEAIAYAHQRGVIHRDLKPSNVLLDRNGEPKVTDFGLAKRIDTGRGLTATGQIVGTPSYMAPEQAAGKVSATNEPADIYALGAILYALMTGQPPFHAEHPVHTVLLVLQQDVRPPRQLNSKVPRDLETICLKCLEKEPAKRYASAGELADDLGRFLIGEPVIARPLGFGRRLRRWASREPGLATTWAAVAAFYAYHAACYWLLELPDLTPQFHRAATALCISWCAGAALFQRRLRGPQRTLFLFLWATWDVFLLTVFLFVTDSAKSPLALVYHVLVASSVLRTRHELVGYVTALALAGYFCHVLYTVVYLPEFQLRFSEVLPFTLSLAVIGLIQYLALKRTHGAPEPIGTSG